MAIKYKYSFANYPLSFRGCKVSPNKICLQFNDPQIKLRLHGEGQELPKTGPNSERYVAVTTSGVNIDCTAVGCPMNVVEDYQMQLINAFEYYNRLYRHSYKEIYGKDFKDFCLQLQAKVNRLVDMVTKDEN